MEQVLLWVSLLAGVLLFLCRFLPVGSRTGSDALPTAEAEIDPAVPSASPLRFVALAVPFLGLLATLPSSAGPFHPGQKLGLGFLIGGLAALGAGSRSKRGNSEPAPFLRLASSYGASIAAVALASLFLRQSLMDALMGVALGGFCVYFALFLDLPRAARTGEAGTRLACGAGFLAALAAGVGLAAFRDSVTPDLPKLAWAATILAFVALGSLLASGASLLVPTRSGASRLAPLGVLILVGGLILYLLAQKITNSSPLFLPGIGGLLLWPVALVVVREERRGNRAGSGQGEPVRPALLVAALLVVSGFLAALQLMQGAGAAVGILALFLAHLGTLSFEPQTSNSDGENGKMGSHSGTVTSLLLLGTLLLLWRFFVTRWASDLRGVQLTDQYALFGLLVGAALPRLLSVIPQRYSGGKASAAWGTLIFCTVLSLACPAAVLVLFGAKSAVALLIGLALGVLPWASQNASHFPGFFALAISLALAQFTGYGIPVHAPTRMEKIRVLLMIMAGVVVAVFAARRIGQGGTAGTGANEETEQ